MIEGMRFSLRTLLIVMLIAGPLCAFGWRQWQLYQTRREMEAAHNNRVVWEKAIRSASQITSTSTKSEIWDQQKDSISWESFPESQPPK